MTYQFTGFNVGEAVDITATQGAASDQDSVSAWASSAPVLSNLNVTDDGGGNGTLAVEPDIDCTIYIWIGPTGTTPTAQDVRDGVGANASLTQAVTTTGGPYGLTLPSGLDGNYRVSVVGQVGAGALSNVLTQTPVAFDTTLPGIVSFSPLDDATDVAIATNLVLTFTEAMNTTAGTVTLKIVGGATVETFDLSAAAGTWTSGDTVLTLNPASDLSNLTSYAVQYSGLLDTNGNALPDVADDVTWNFTTAAAAGGNPTLTALSNQTDGTTSSTKNLTGMTLSGSTGNEHIALVAWNGAVDVLLSSATIDGQAATIVAQESGSSSADNIALIRAPSTANATGTVALTFGAGVRETIVDLWECTNFTSIVAVTATSETGAPNLDQNTAANDAVLAGAINSNGTAWSWAALTAQTSVDIRSAEWFGSAFANGVAAETPRQIRPTTTSVPCNGISAVIS